MRSIDNEVVVARRVGSDAYVHAFEQEDGDVIVVGWLQTMVAGRRGDIGDGSHVDGRSEAISVSVPRALDGAATRYDELGNTQELAAPRRSGDETHLDLTLKGGQVQIVHLSK